MAADVDGDIDGMSRSARRLEEAVLFLRGRLAGEYEVDDFGLDTDLAERILFPALRPLADTWFRIEVQGAENLPVDGGALVMSNHSGTVPLDAVMTAFVVHDRTGRFLRPLGADLVFRLPFVGSLARKGGATVASGSDAVRMLTRGELVGVWPEGYQGLGKRFSQRYRVQRFGRDGHVSAAVRTGAPIVPCSVVGAEEIYPLVGDVAWLARLLGLPYVPITPLFPWFGVLGLVPLPSKWLIGFGEPIATDSYGAAAADDLDLVLELTEQVRDTIGRTLVDLRRQRGDALG